MTRLSLMTRPSAVSSMGSAVVPLVFLSSHSGRGFVTSTTRKSTSFSRPFSASRIFSRWLNGQTGI